MGQEQEEDVEEEEGTCNGTVAWLARLKHIYVVCSRSTWNRSRGVHETRSSACAQLIKQC